MVCNVLWGFRIKKAKYTYGMSKIMAALAPDFAPDTKSSDRAGLSRTSCFVSSLEILFRLSK